MRATRRSFKFHILMHTITTILLSIWVSADYQIQDTLLQCLESHTDPSDNKNISEIFFSNSNPSYQSLLQAYARNLRFNLPKTPKPHFIITPFKKTHVSSTVICSKILGFELRIRSAGHDYEGLSYTTLSTSNPFIVLDLFHLNSVIVNVANQTAYAMSGATLGEVYYRIWEKTRVHGFPAGICPTVGVGGHISGGGYGNMIRKYGLSVDHVIDAEIVNANGEILDRKSMGEDLFWAIRGGGGASFGVLLSYTLNLVHVPEIVTVSSVVRYLSDNATDLVYKWQFFMKEVDDDLFIRLLLQPKTVKQNKKKVKTVKITFIIFFLGNRDRLMSIINSGFPELGLKSNDCKEMSWIESVLDWYHYPVGTEIEALLNRTYKSSFSKRKSDYVTEPIPKNGFELLWKKLIELGKPGLVFNPYGGIMSKVSESETAFPHRDGNLFKIQYSITWHEIGEEAESKYLSLIREMYDFMTPYVLKNPRRAYLNYRDLDIGVYGKGSYEEGKSYGEMYFDGNFERLVQVKTKVDPENLFKNEQSIPVCGSSGAKHMTPSSGKKHVPRVIRAFISCVKLQVKDCLSNVYSVVYDG